MRTPTRTPFRWCRPRTFFKRSNLAAPQWPQRSKKYLKKPRMEQAWTRLRTTNSRPINKIHRRASLSWLGSPNCKSPQATKRSYRAKCCSRCRTNAWLRWIASLLIKSSLTKRHKDRRKSWSNLRSSSRRMQFLKMIPYLASLSRMIRRVLKNKKTRTGLLTRRP